MSRLLCQFGGSDFKTFEALETRCLPTIGTARQRGEGRVALENELGALGVKFHHSRPYHPQTCGKVERFHQTQKKWLAAQRPAPTIRTLQRQLDRFADYYNNQRPHRALNRKTPTQAYAARPKATPTGPKIPAHYRVRNDIIDAGGSVTLRHNSRLHHIGLGTPRAPGPESRSWSTTYTSGLSDATPQNSSAS